MLAVRGATGEYAWHYQTVPGDNWEYNATMNIVLADLEIHGEKRRVLLHRAEERLLLRDRSRHGRAHLRGGVRDGELGDAHRPESRRPIERPTRGTARGSWLIRPTRGPQLAADGVSPRTGLVYIPAVIDLPDAVTYHSDVEIDDSEIVIPPMQNGRAHAPGRLLAGDPVAQRERWAIERPLPFNGGLLATAGNLVFQGTADGRFIAYQADTGAKAWEMAVGSPINAAPVTYELDGTQYIAVMAAWGGSPGSVNPMGPAVIPGRLLVFALGGKAKIAPLTTSSRPRRSPHQRHRRKHWPWAVRLTRGAARCVTAPTP